MRMRRRVIVNVDGTGDRDGGVMGDGDGDGMGDRNGGGMGYCDLRDGEYMSLAPDST